MAKKKVKTKEITRREFKFANIIFMQPEIFAHDAYMQAGFHPGSIESAKAAASKLLTKVNLKAYLAKLRAVVTTETGIDGAKVVKELGKLAFSNIKNYMNIEDDEVYFKNFDEIPEEQLAAVESVKVMRKIIKGKIKLDADGNNIGDDDVELQQIQFKLHSKTNTLEQLGKHLGIYEKDNAQKAQTIFDILAIVGINVNGN